LFDHRRRVARDFSCFAWSCMAHDDVRISDVRRFAQNEKRLTIPHQTRRPMPMMDAAPILMRDLAGRYDHALALEVTRKIGKGRNRVEGVCRQDRLPAEERDAVNGTPGVSKDVHPFSSGRPLAQQPVEIDVFVGRCSEKRSGGRFILRPDCRYGGGDQVSLTTNSGLVVGALLPPSGSTLTAMAATVDALTGSETSATPERSGMNVMDGAIFCAPTCSVHA